MTHEHEMSVMRLLYHTSRRHMNRIHSALSEHEVYPGQPPLMFALAHENGQSQKDLAAKLEIKASTLTVMLNRMERNGIVQRKPDEHDQRISRIYLTDKGFELLNIVRETLGSLEKQALQGLTEEEIRQLSGLLSRIHRNIRGTEPDAEAVSDRSQDGLQTLLDDQGEKV